MAITKSEAVTFFLGRTKGDSFWAQKADGTVSRCGFSVFEPDDVQNPATGIVTFGISIYPISADFEVTYLNLDSLGSASSVFIDFKVALGDITFSSLFGGSGASATSLKAPVVAGSTVNLVVTAVGSGIGKTLTGPAEALVIDGISMNNTERVLVKNQTILSDNGIYEVTDKGGIALPWVLTRAEDFDEQGEVVGGVIVTIQSGTTQDDTSWILTNITGIATLDTDDIVFTLYPTTITEEVKTQTLTINFVNSAQEDFSVIMNTSTPKILSSRLYIETPGAFDKLVMLSFYSNVARKGSTAIQRFEKTLSSTTISGALSGSETSLVASDTLSFHPNDLFMFLDSQELSRIEGVTESTATFDLEDAVEGAHNNGTDISKIMEVSGFSVYDDSNSNKVYLRMKFLENVTATFKLVMVYTEL